MRDCPPAATDASKTATASPSWMQNASAGQRESAGTPVNCSESRVPSMVARWPGDRVTTMSLEPERGPSADGEVGVEELPQEAASVHVISVTTVPIRIVIYGRGPGRRVKDPIVPRRRATAKIRDGGRPGQRGATRGGRADLGNFATTV
jgi:hypothetical protein